MDNSHVALISRVAVMARDVERELQILEAAYSAAMDKEDYTSCFRLYGLIEDRRSELHELWELLE